MLDERIERLLRRVQKPSRYVGGEWNAGVKDWDAADVRMALGYPDLYEAGISDMGLQVLYRLVNDDPRFLCDRVFTPWRDMAAALREEGLPLYSLDAERPIAEFDIVKLCLGPELSFTNVLETLELAKIPLLARERDEAYPLVVGGGSRLSNPEPLADFVDLFLVGEEEEVLQDLLELYRQMKGEAQGQRPTKADLLAQAVLIPGVYVPAFYEVTHNGDGTVAAITPTCRGVPRRVRRRFQEKLGPPLANPIVPYLEAVDDRGAIEIQRGCARPCTECSEAMDCRVLRTRHPEEILAAIDALVRGCGYQEIALVSSGAGDYSHMEELVKAVRARFSHEELLLSFAPARIDQRTAALAAALQGTKRRGYPFTLAASSERLRGLLNRPLPDEVILASVETAFKLGWSGISYNCPVGQPGESPEDIRALVELVAQTQKVGRRILGRRPRVRIVLSLFTPKAHTPSQRMAQETPETLREKLGLLRQGLKRMGVQLSWTEPDPAMIEGVLSAGDRRVGQALHRAWQLGCTFSGLSEGFNVGRWLQAFQESGIDPAFYAHRAREPQETLPWSHLDASPTRPLDGEETEKGRRRCLSQPCAICAAQARRAAREPAAAPT